MRFVKLHRTVLHAVAARFCITCQLWNGLSVTHAVLGNVVGVQILGPKKVKKDGRLLYVIHASR